MRIVIILEGGLVRDVWTDRPECNYAVVDLDIDGLEPERISKTPLGQDCHLRVDRAGYDPDYVRQVFHGEQPPGVSPELVLDMAAVLAEVIASHDNWRDCSDQREALAVWSETVNKARHVINRITGVATGKEGSDNG